MLHVGNTYNKPLQ